MTDIVIRLRAKTYGPNLLGLNTDRLPSDVQLEAAEEIERLREALRVSDALLEMYTDKINGYVESVKW